MVYIYIIYIIYIYIALKPEYLYPAEVIFLLCS